MRLWSIDPSYLDAKGLVALWREGLLARAVLRGKTKGYTRHPQLTRFRLQPSPVEAIDAYLEIVVREADSRGYRFDRRKIGPVKRPPRMVVTDGQLSFEIEHLRRKLAVRDPDSLARIEVDSVTGVRPHPSFEVIEGPIETWERGAG